LQRGLFAAYLLQFSNVGCRFGTYGSLKQFFGMKQGGELCGCGDAGNMSFHMGLR
jgi:hypothetical protein